MIGVNNNLAFSAIAVVLLLAVLHAEGHYFFYSSSTLYLVN